MMISKTIMIIMKKPTIRNGTGNGTKTKNMITIKQNINMVIHIVTPMETETPMTLKRLS